jgi:Septin
MSILADLYTEITTTDIEFLRQLSPIANVIPVIAKADTLTPEGVSTLKHIILSELETSGIRPFLFGKPYTDAIENSESSPPFAISSGIANDTENMDASLLMSPDYVQPLFPSELSALVKRVFERDTVAWLRHTAAKKVINWRNGTTLSSLGTRSPYSALTMRPSALDMQRLRIPIGAGDKPQASSPLATQSYALARVADHTQREERMAQVHLAKWATDLQRSLQNERERFESLIKGERAGWLTERLGQCVADGSLVPGSVGHNLALTYDKPTRDSSGALVKCDQFAPNGTRRAEVDARDPLGLLMWNEKFVKKGWVVLRMLGSFGVIGGLAVWVARSWGVDGEEPMIWNRDWFGNGE